MKYIFDSSAIFRAIKENKIEILAENYTVELARYELGNILWKDCGLQAKISEEEVLTLIEIIERVNKYAPEILENMDEQEEKTQDQIFVEQACHCLEWIKATKHGMNPTRYGFIKDIAKGQVPYNFENETVLAALKKDLIEFGYKPV
jgi:hypothetical protein